MKKIEDLINTQEPGWKLVSEWLSIATNKFEILPRNQNRAKEELFNIQVTTRSPMGAIIYETGGILIDGGWIRILGSGSEKLNRGIYEWNKGKTIINNQEPPAHLLIADDVIGGYFSINAGGIGSEIGKVYYFAQDSLEWECLNINYSEFIHWLLAGGIEIFYENFRWNGWQNDLESINGCQTFSFYPLLCTKEGKDMEGNRRHAISIEENYGITFSV